MNEVFWHFQILTANEMACELFGFKDDELIGTQLHSLVSVKSKTPLTVGENYLEGTGEVLEVAGKVVSIGLIF